MSSKQGKVDELAQVIDDLKKQRDHHLEQIEQIDAAFEQHGIDPESISGRSAPTRSKTAARGRKKGARKKRRRGRFSRTGEESVLAFVRQHGPLTAKEVNEYWQAEGRGGKADNALSKLVSQGQLKRVKNKEGRGSRYQIAR